MKKVNLTESDLTRIIKNIVNEQETGGLYNAIVRFHPELKGMSPGVGQAIDYIFEGGKFHMLNMKVVCTKTPEFCKVAFTTPEVMDKVFKIV